MTAATTTTCPKCGASNPLGAKFCSSCRNPLKAAQPTPPPVPPTPPPRPGPNVGFMGAIGGKAETLTFSDEPEAIYGHLSAFFSTMKGAEIQQDVPQQQLLVKIPFSSFNLTMGRRIYVDSMIRLAPAPGGGTQISVQGKTDNSSTTGVWALIIAGWGSIALLWILWAMIAWAIPMLGLALGLSWWIMQTSPPEEVAKNIFKYLGKQRGKTAPASTAAAAAAAAPTPPPPPQPAPQPEKPQPEAAQSEQAQTAPAQDSDDDEEVFDRIAKLAKLKEAGAISEAEFEAKKTELLARI